MTTLSELSTAQASGLDTDKVMREIYLLIGGDSYWPSMLAGWTLVLPHAQSPSDVISCHLHAQKRQSVKEMLCHHNSRSTMGNAYYQ